jgi:hypothetical protein
VKSIDSSLRLKQHTSQELQSGASLTHGASHCSHDSLEGLFFDDSYRPSANTAEFTTSPPHGGPADGGPADSAAADKRLVFSSRCGRVRLANVTVRNAGIDWDSGSNIYWRHMVGPCSCVGPHQ